MSTASEPSISAPKGGGAVGAINEFFRPDLFTGTGNCSIPIACSHGRAGFGPQPTLQYSTGFGNSAFGLGWDLGTARISRRTDKGVPRYSDDDTFTLTGADDLVPVCDAAGTIRVVPRLGYDVTRFRPRRESTFARIERWRRTADGDTHWRVTSRENVTSIFGRSPVARLDDGGDPARVWSWLLDESFDAAGNHIKYEYAQDAPGQDRSAPFEARRSYRQRYLRRIFYGNLASVLQYTSGAAVGPARSGTHHLQYDQAVTRHYVFELLFDYGDLPALPADPYVAPPPGAESFSDVAAAGVRVAPVRSDPFSSYRSGFELRTLRRCTRALMFHHLQELGGPTLVRSTDFDYDTDGHSGTSRLIRVHTRGYARDNAGYAASSLPPIALAYSDFDPSRRRYQSLAVARGEGPSRSVSHPGQVILDVYGDGLPDVVQWTASGIRVWRNRGGGTLEAPLMMPVQPSHAALGDPGVAIADMDGDTMPDLVVHDRGVRGFYEMTPDAGWQPFRHYHTVPNVSLNDPNVRLLDLTGNGRSDVLVTTPAHFVWFENLGDGFSPPRHIDRIHDLDRFPDLSFAGDPARVRIADMNGDGLPDLVLLHDGRVDYWPSLGYGRFGPRVTMANAPRLAWPFDPRRVMLADLDGSGCADLVYVHGDHVDYWFNRSGNAWSEKAVVPGTPPLASPDDLVVADVFGSGTATLVWTYGAGVLAGGNYKALDFCGGVKPNLLVRLANNVGATMRFTYAPSTKFFLADRDAGRPWVTALPFVVHVIEQTETIDHIGRFREVSRFAYHHGYYDRREREFRGFGCVERFDTEDQAAAAAVALDDGRAPDNADAAYWLPPVVTRTWFHTGAYFAEGEQLSARYTREYFSGDPQAFTLPAHDIAADALPAEAVAALRGTQLRAEMYGLDGSAKEGIPYTVSESRYAVRLLQPAGGDAPHSVLQVIVTDELAHRYERVPDDPRVTHNLVAGVDAYGNVTQQIAIAYPRRAPSAHPEQQEPRIGFTWQQFINADRDDAYRVGVMCDSRRFEIHGGQTTLPASRRWTTGDFASLLADVDRFEPFEAKPTTFCKRLLLWSRHYFRRDTSVDVVDPPDSTAHRLPWGEIGRLGLPYQTYQAVLTPGLRAQVYGSRVTDADLRRAGYTPASDVVSGAAGRDYWWAGSGRHGHGSPFLRATIVQDAFGSRSAISYDQYDLLPIKTADALTNEVTASNDYRVLQPWRSPTPTAIECAPCSIASASLSPRLKWVPRGRPRAIRSRPAFAKCRWRRSGSIWRRPMPQVSLRPICWAPRPRASSTTSGASTISASRSWRARSSASGMSRMRRPAAFGRPSSIPMDSRGRFSTRLSLNRGWSTACIRTGDGWLAD